MSDSVRRLGVDTGARRIGLALSEPELQVAYPFRTLQPDGPRKAAHLIAEQIRATGAEEVVLGLPLRLDGSEGESARRVRRLAGLLEKLTSARLVLWDERLSTAAAARALSDAGVSSRKRRASLDRSAAVLILQSYLDSQRERRWEDEQSFSSGPLAAPSRKQSRDARSRRRRGR